VLKSHSRFQTQPQPPSPNGGKHHSVTALAEDPAAESQAGKSRRPDYHGAHVLGIVWSRRIEEPKSNGSACARWS